MGSLAPPNSLSFMSKIICFSYLFANCPLVWYISLEPLVIRITSLGMAVNLFTASNICLQVMSVWNRLLIILSCVFIIIYKLFYYFYFLSALVYVYNSLVCLKFYCNFIGYIFIGYIMKFC